MENHYIQEFKFNRFNDEQELGEFVAKNRISREDIIDIINNTREVFLITNAKTDKKYKKLSKKK